MVSESTRDELLRLSPADRIRVAQDLWDSVADRTKDLQLTDTERALLDQRLAAYHADPDQGDSWEVVRERIRSASRETR
ncbi:MAG: addiction module protein [Phycisphaeraceae bacterium]